MESKGLGAVRLPGDWNILVLTLASAISYPSPPYQVLTSVHVSPAPRAPYQLCPSQNSLSFPLPSLLSPSLIPSLPFLPPRKTKSNSLPLLHTHTQLFPLQDFWPLLTVSALRKEGRRGVMHYPTPLPVFLGIVLMLLASILCTSTHNPSKPLIPSRLKARAPWKRESPEEPHRS